MSEKQQSKISQHGLMKLIERQGFRCALSGRELTPRTASLDHKVPLTRGGPHCLENLWFVHEMVNRAKGTMTAEEFVALCHEVIRHHDNPVRRKLRARGSVLTQPNCIKFALFPLFEENPNDQGR